MLRANNMTGKLMRDGGAALSQVFKITKGVPPPNCNDGRDVEDVTKGAARITRRRRGEPDNMRLVRVIWGDDAMVACLVELGEIEC
jgi:hypothetical protein